FVLDPRQFPDRHNTGALTRHEPGIHLAIGHDEGVRLKSLGELGTRFEDGFHQFGGAVSFTDADQVRPLRHLAVGVRMAGTTGLTLEEGFTLPRISPGLQCPSGGNFIRDIADLIRIFGVRLLNHDRLLGFRLWPSLLRAGYPLESDL